MAPRQYLDDACAPIIGRHLFCAPCQHAPTSLTLPCSTAVHTAHAGAEFLPQLRLPTFDGTARRPPWRQTQVHALSSTTTLASTRRRPRHPARQPFCRGGPLACGRRRPSRLPTAASAVESASGHSHACCRIIVGDIPRAHPRAPRRAARRAALAARPRRRAARSPCALATVRQRWSSRRWSG